MLPAEQNSKGLTTQEVESEFNKLTPEEKQRRVNELSSRMGSVKEMGNAGRFLEALIDEEKMKTIGVYSKLFKSSTQLPFSSEFIYFEINKEMNVRFSMDNENWHPWEASDENFELVSRLRFKSVFDDQLIRTFMSKELGRLVANSVIYFSNTTNRS